MSRNYRELAAERLAENAELKLKMSALETELQRNEKELSHALKEADKWEKEHKNITEAWHEARSENYKWEKLADEHSEDMDALRGVVRAQKSLLKRIYWFLVTYPIEGDLAAVSARQGLIDDIDRINND